MKRIGLTHKEHIQNANDLSIVIIHLFEMYKRCANAYGKSHRITRLLDRLLPCALSNNIFVKLKSALDDEYHRVTTDKEFKEQGHVYYNLEKRYEYLIDSKKQLTKFNF